MEPEALNKLIRHSQRAITDVSVVFTYEGFTVQVEDGGSIKIMDSPPDESWWLM
ncbi:HalOD1 output domain-containing protein [Natrarchaeobius chitinivorans]|uniref:HalOD1 output domain-containing protein n=1 Tax=Natrarchaeobius chitinivorans TaxID=1679083 RepID=UPI0037423A5E